MEKTNDGFVSKIIAISGKINNNKIISSIQEAFYKIYRKNK